MNDFIGAGAFALTSAWILYFYTTFCGLSPIQAASIFALARVGDAVASPTMGVITDNFHKTKLGKRFGRMKFFLLLAIPLVGVYTTIWISSFLYAAMIFTGIFVCVLIIVYTFTWERSLEEIEAAEANEVKEKQVNM